MSKKNFTRAAVNTEAIAKIRQAYSENNIPAYTADKDRPYHIKDANSRMMTAQNARAGLVMTGTGWALSGLGFILVILIILGPGISAIMNMFEAIAWYWWLIILAGLILMIRRK